MPEQQDIEQQDIPEGAVTAEQLLDIPGPPPTDGDNMAGPRATSEERARQAAEHAEAKAAEDTGA